VPPLAPPVRLTLETEQLGTANWPEGPAGVAATGASFGELTCGATTHGPDGYHIHSHLAIYVNGELQRIPANLGIGGPQAARPGCMYAIHTHLAAGTLHVEWPEPRRFTLGEFFTLWGQPLTATNVAGIAGMPIVIYVYEGGTAFRYQGDPAEIELRPSRGIAFQIGTPLTVLPRYFWSNDPLP
jgi:hypothetical protein